VEYFTKPFDGRELIKKVQDVLKANAIPKKTVSTGHGFYLGQSRAMKELYEIIERVAASDVNVLVLGESGVGKERVARLIHDQGVRKDYPFVVVDCGSTPTGLLESELFGHVKGSFTHAIRDKKGLMEAAHTGTLFLDEIGNISSEMQVRLLRFLEDRKIRRIGDIREISVDCRVIAATNSNLADEIREGNFREDLYYRLRVVSLTIPPLRERKEDIPAFAQNFAEAFCKSKGIAPIKLLPETIEYLCRYRWPGNVRELKNALEGGIVLSQNGVLRSEDLQLARISENPKSPENPFSLDDSERDTIVRALRESGGVQKDAADLLGISRRAIHYKIKKYGIKISDIRANGR
jgi:DNA-binding NtrC family response regulator